MATTTVCLAAAAESMWSSEVRTPPPWSIVAMPRMAMRAAARESSPVCGVPRVTGYTSPERAANCASALAFEEHDVARFAHGLGGRHGDGFFGRASGVHELDHGCGGTAASAASPAAALVVALDQ